MAIINRVWAMPNKHTFLVRPLMDVVRKYMTNSPGRWIDPFAGYNSPADVTNDLNPETPAQFHMEAVDFLAQQEDNSCQGVIFDPPYSLIQVSLSYKNIGLKLAGTENPTGGFPRAKDQIARCTALNGVVISFGWNTCGMGKKRGFEPIEFLICCHEGNHNDTLVTVEKKTIQLVDTTFGGN